MTDRATAGALVQDLVLLNTMVHLPHLTHLGPGRTAYPEAEFR